MPNPAPMPPMLAQGPLEWTTAALSWMHSTFLKISHIVVSTIGIPAVIRRIRRLVCCAFLASSTSYLRSQHTSNISPIPRKSPIEPGLNIWVYPLEPSSKVSAKVIKPHAMRYKCVLHFQLLASSSSSGTGSFALGSVGHPP